MEDRDLKNQLEGLFSDIEPEDIAGLTSEGQSPEETSAPVEGEPQGVVAEPAIAKDEPKVEPAVSAPVDAVVSETVELEPETPPIAAGDEIVKPTLSGSEPSATIPEQVGETAPESSAPLHPVTSKQQQNRMLNIMLGSLTAIGFLTVFPLAVQLAHDPSRWRPYALYFVAYAVLWAITLAQRLNPTVRTVILIALTYVVGTLSLVHEGLRGTGVMYLLVAPLLFSILFRRRVSGLASAGSAAASILIFAGVVLAVHVGWIQPAGVVELGQPLSVLTLCSTFAMMVAGIPAIQWMSSSTLTTALKETEEDRAKITRSQALAEGRAEDLSIANVLLQERTLQLQTANEIAHAATSELDPGELVQQAVDLIGERFDLYYVGLLLIEESNTITGGRQAVLQAATGEAGRQMLAQGHAVAVDDLSTIGQCIASAQARVAFRSDPGNEIEEGVQEIIETDPSLPETQSQAALPLRSRGQVIGLLDVHSTQPQAFPEETVTVLQAIADQIAVAIDNARLLTETRERLEEIEARQRLYVRERWAELVPGQVAPLHQRTKANVPALGDVALAEVEKAVTQQRLVVEPGIGNGRGQAALVAPITLRGEVVGALGLHDTAGSRQWTDDEITLIESIADQMAQAIENVRLLEETQQRAGREQMLSQMTARFTQSLDMDTLLRSAVRELGQMPNVAEVSVHIGTPEPSSEAGNEQG